MGKYFRTSVSFVLAILFVVLCFMLVIGFSLGSWLHTYKTFTQKRLVAVIEVSELKEDGEKTYADIKYRPVDDQSAFAKILTSKTSEGESFEEEQNYLIYGDHFEIGGEIVKFNDFWHLFNLRNIYKVSRLEGDYVNATSDVSSERTVIQLNGGTDNYWKEFQRNQERYSFFVDSVYGNFATRFIQDEPETYSLYITEDGFILDIYEK